MIGMDPACLNLMQADFVDLLNGPDACDVVMTWETGTPDSVYPGRWAGTPTVHTQTFRGVLVFAKAYRVQTGHVTRGVMARRFAEVPDADIGIIMPATVAMKGLINVTFTVSGLGSYRPLEKPVEDQGQYTVMFPAGQAMVQWVFAKAVK